MENDTNFYDKLRDKEDEIKDKIISQLPKIFTSHDFIWKFIEEYEDIYIPELWSHYNKRTGIAFREVNRQIGKFLSANREDLGLKKIERTDSKNIHGNYTPVREWEKL